MQSLKNRDIPLERHDLPEYKLHVDPLCIEYWERQKLSLLGTYQPKSLNADLTCFLTFEQQLVAETQKVVQIADRYFQHEKELTKAEGRLFTIHDYSVRVFCDPPITDLETYAFYVRFYKTIKNSNFQIFHAYKEMSEDDLLVLQSYTQSANETLRQHAKDLLNEYRQQGLYRDIVVCLNKIYEVIFSLHYLKTGFHFRTRCLEAIPLGMTLTKEYVDLYRIVQGDCRVEGEDFRLKMYQLGALCAEAHKRKYMRLQREKDTSSLVKETSPFSNPLPDPISFSSASKEKKKKTAPKQVKVKEGVFLAEPKTNKTCAPQETNIKLAKRSILQEKWISLMGQQVRYAKRVERFFGLSPNNLSPMKEFLDRGSERRYADLSDVELEREYYAHTVPQVEKLFQDETFLQEYAYKTESGYSCVTELETPSGRWRGILHIGFDEEGVIMHRHFREVTEEALRKTHLVELLNVAPDLCEDQFYRKEEEYEVYYSNCLITKDPLTSILSLKEDDRGVTLHLVPLKR